MNFFRLAAEKKTCTTLRGVFRQLAEFVGTTDEDMRVGMYLSFTSFSTITPQFSQQNCWSSAFGRHCLPL